MQAKLGLTGGAGGVADINRDGVVDSFDAAMVNADAGPALPAGMISLSNVANPLGYAGYHFNPEFQVYLARHRYYDPVLGRWLTRDPAGYVDGMNLYLYGLGSPFVFVDPMGLWVAGGLCWKTFGKSLWENTGGAVIDGVASLGGMAIDAAEFTYYNATGDYLKAASTERGQAFMSEVAAGNGPLQAMVNVDIVNPTKALYQSATQTVQDALGGDIDAIGSVLRAPGEIVVGGKGLDKVAKVAKGLKSAPTNTPSTPAQKVVNHHSDPKFMGGNPKQPTTRMPERQHIDLHRDLNTHLRGYTDGQGNHMRPQRGNSGQEIRHNFTEQQRQGAMADFYRTYGDRYGDAALDFFRQYPHLK